MSNKEILKESVSNIIESLEKERNRARKLFHASKGDIIIKEYYNELDDSIIKYNYILSSLSEEHK